MEIVSVGNVVAAKASNFLKDEQSSTSGKDRARRNDHIGNAVIMVADELPEWGNLSPESLNGSLVRDS
jgi:hypothetical protein